MGYQDDINPQMSDDMMSNQISMGSEYGDFGEGDSDLYEIATHDDVR